MSLSVAVVVFSVPSSNKRDLRSIEEALQDMRFKKKTRSDKEVEGSGVNEEEGDDSSPPDEQRTTSY